MATLITHNNEYVDTLFQLLGDKENDLTRAIAWTLKKSPSFLKLLVFEIAGESIETEDTIILYQQFEKTGTENGYTDLEITDGRNIHVILEAKRGWALPGIEQIEKYAHRASFVNSKAVIKWIVSISECSQIYAKSNLPIKITDNNIPVSHVSWKRLNELALLAMGDSNNEQKRLLIDFSKYLKGLMTMQDKNSNLVYVVSIRKDLIPGTSLTWVDVVEKTGHYFCPVGINGWPKEPPNYIAFRYDGKLQAIHHIEKYTVSKNIHDVIDDMPDEEWDNDHFILDLGPKISPSKEIRTGKGIFRNGRVWAAIDLLLTCDTITEARDKTKERE